MKKMFFILVLIFLISVVCIHSVEYGGDLTLGATYSNTEDNYYLINDKEERIYGESLFNFFVKRENISADISAGLIKDDFYYEKSGSVGVSIINGKYGNLRTVYSYLNNEDLSTESFDYNKNDISLNFMKYFNDNFFINTGGGYYSINYENKNEDIQDYNTYLLDMILNYKFVTLVSEYEIYNYSEGLVPDVQNYYNKISLNIYKPYFIINNDLGYDCRKYENENYDYYNYHILTNNLRIGKRISKIFLPFIIGNISQQNTESVEKNYYMWESGIELNIFENPIEIKILYGQLKYDKLSYENLNYDKYLFAFNYNYYANKIFLNISEDFQLNYYSDIRESINDESLNSGYINSINFDFEYTVIPQIRIRLGGFHEYNNNYLIEESENNPADDYKDYYQYRGLIGMGYNLHYMYLFNVDFEYIKTVYNTNKSSSSDFNITATMQLSF
ncbi:MAG: hypothetical protein FXF47_04640 [Candidatus Mcinerneyibacterium aminivorans]|uniref:Uncharacterized protein n=1 Tax=Candidatus Mcinerneyibacterium aminivorans TaxID=2703815 RepID=A0A5D0MIN6_9BACT|nr:MAG: hypothetical protein FXF47_04640 [Candidatus Mcinerneyibacterium aminivorans]